MEVNFLCSLLSMGDVVLDVGANIGTHTLAFATTVGPTGVVLAFEPHPQVFQLLSANVRQNSLANAEPRNLGLADHAGPMYVQPLQLHESGNFGHLLVYEEGGGSAGASLEVPMDTVDSLSLDRCDLIKVDVEGMEVSVLKGAVETIQRCRPTIYCECRSVGAGYDTMRLLQEQRYLLWLHQSALFNADNWHGSSEDIFGLARESYLLAIPDERRERFAYLLAGQPDLQVVDSLDTLARAVLDTPREGDPAWGTLTRPGLLARITRLHEDKVDLESGLRSANDSRALIGAEIDDLRRSLGTAEIQAEERAREIDDLRRSLGTAAIQAEERAREIDDLRRSLGTAAIQAEERAREIDRLTLVIGASGSGRPRLKSTLRRLHDRLPWYVRPNPLFDKAWYSAQYPDVRGARLGAYWHYRRHGWREGRDPNPYFDTDWYLRRYPDVAAAQLEPLDHYLRFGGREVRDPGPRFDATRYLRANPDVAEEGLNPLLHYLRHGRPEGRVATPLVDERPAAPSLPQAALVAEASSQPEPVQAPPRSVTAEPYEFDDAVQRLPKGAGIVVAGDDGLTTLAGMTSGNRGRPPLPLGTPMSGRAAVVQMEAARWLSADYFVLPPTTWWWMDHFPELASHLDGWYLPVSQNGSSRIWDLRRPGLWIAMDELVDRVADRSDEPASVLVWRSSRDLESVLPESRVFRPISDASPLPYLDGTVDIVALGDLTKDALIEAKRVASVGVVDVSSGQPSIVWQAASSGMVKSAVSIGLLVGRRGLASDRWLRLFAQDLPKSMQAEILVVGRDLPAAAAGEAPPFDYTSVVVRGKPTTLDLVDRVVQSARNEAVVVIDTRAVPIPGSVVALLRTLASSDDVALVSAARVDAVGRWLASDRRPGKTADDIDAPARNITQQVDHGALALAALRKEPYLAARSNMSATARPSTTAALGEQVRRLGKHWVSTPDAIAIIPQNK